MSDITWSDIDFGSQHTPKTKEERRIGTPDVPPEVTNIEAVAGLAKRETGVYSRGGMVSKLQAARLAIQSGIPVVIGSGLRPNVIRTAVNGGAVGTRFVP